MSRIYEAMQRGALAEASHRSHIALAADGAQSVDAVAQGYQRVLQAIQGLQGLHGSKRGGVILVVSAVAGEGASTVARELALLLGRDGLARPVLVDANLRAPTQHRAFGVERARGLSEVALQGLALDQALRNGASSPIPLLTCGRPAGNPAGLLGTPAVASMIESLRSRFDWVVVDASPITVYSDAAILAPLADGVVLVVEAERTRWEVVSQAKRTLEESGGRILGAVLNRQRYHIPPALYGRL